MDKIAANNLTLVEGEAVSVPAIKEYPLTLECRVTYKQLQDDNAIAPEDIAKFYKPGYGGTHIAYFGEIVANGVPLGAFENPNSWCEWTDVRVPLREGANEIVVRTRAGGGGVWHLGVRLPPAGVVAA